MFFTFFICSFKFRAFWDYVQEMSAEDICTLQKEAWPFTRDAFREACYLIFAAQFRVE
jgi:hypothetical protein